MVDAYVESLNLGENGYSGSYGIQELRNAISSDEISKGWNCDPSDVYVTHGVTEALQDYFLCCTLRRRPYSCSRSSLSTSMAYPQMSGAITEEYMLDPDDSWKVRIDDIRNRMSDDVQMLSTYYQIILLEM